MDCSEFLSRFSEFYDQDPTLEDRSEFEDHLEGCPSCDRYLKVVEQGGKLLRELPVPRLRGDFFPRLQHRIFNLDQEEAVRRSTGGSSFTAGTAFAVAALLVLIVWYPDFRSEPPDVELPAIVVKEPPPRAPVLSSSPRPAQSVGASGSFDERALWTQSHSLLYEHSPLGQRHRDVFRAGLP